MTIEAQNLTGQHRGHHATYQATGPNAGNQTHAGTIVQVKHLGDGQTTIVTRGLDGLLGWAHVPADTPVTVTPASSQPAYEGLLSLQVAPAGRSSGRSAAGTRP